MASEEEIERRVEDVDAAKTARRAAAAKHVGELARQRAAVAAQLADLDTKLGDVLTAASDVIDVDELARFTDVPVDDLTRWRDGKKPTRPRRPRSTAGTTAAKPPPARQAPTLSAGPGTGLPAQVPMKAT